MGGCRSVRSLLEFWRKMGAAVWVSRKVHVYSFVVCSRELVSCFFFLPNHFLDRYITTFGSGEVVFIRRGFFIIALSDREIYERGHDGSSAGVSVAMVGVEQNFVFFAYKMYHDPHTPFLVHTRALSPIFWGRP